MLPLGENMKRSASRACPDSLRALSGRCCPAAPAISGWKKSPPWKPGCATHPARVNRSVLQCTHGKRLQHHRRMNEPK